MGLNRRCADLTLAQAHWYPLRLLPADVAQRQSKGLISLWPVVRFHPSAPHPGTTHPLGANPTIYNPKTRNIGWEPTAGARVKKGIQSPALGLKHEMDHAAKHDQTGKAISLTKDGKTATPEGAKEEFRAVDDEKKSARALGEPTRSSPNEGTIVKVPSPTFSCQNQKGSAPCSP